MTTLPIVLTGQVVRGDERGRLLGFPTANVDVPSVPVLEDGIYAGRVRRADGTEFPAAISIGRRPTYYDADAIRLVEAYLLDFSGDLYGERLIVILDAFIRDQARFDSSEKLIAQIEADVTEVRKRTPLTG